MPQRVRILRSRGFDEGFLQLLTGKTEGDALCRFFSADAETVRRIITRDSRLEHELRYRCDALYFKHADALSDRLTLYWRKLAHEKLLKSIELFGRKVMPMSRELIEAKTAA